MDGIHTDTVVGDRFSSYFNIDSISCDGLGIHIDLHAQTLNYKIIMFSLFIESGF